MLVAVVKNWYEQIHNGHEHHFFKNQEPDNCQCEDSQQKFQRCLRCESKFAWQSCVVKGCKSILQACQTRENCQTIQHETKTWWYIGREKQNPTNSLGKKRENNPPPPASTNTTLYAFRADIDRLNMALKEEKALNKLNLKHLSEIEETLKNERIEHSKMIENLNTANKEKDEWNNSNLEKLHNCTVNKLTNYRVR